MAALTGQPVARAISLPVQCDGDAAFEPQLQALLADLPLMPEALQTEPIVLKRLLAFAAVMSIGPPYQSHESPLGD